MLSPQGNQVSEEIAREAGAAARGLARVLAKKAKTVKLKAEGHGTETVEVPMDAFKLFVQILGQMANGDMVVVMPVTAELTTQQAADMLNVSRPHLIKLLEQGKIKYRMVGTRRRVQLPDLLEYKQNAAAEQDEALRELTAEAERLKLDY